MCSSGTFARLWFQGDQPPQSQLSQHWNDILGTTKPPIDRRLRHVVQGAQLNHVQGPGSAGVVRHRMPGPLSHPRRFVRTLRSRRIASFPVTILDLEVKTVEEPVK